jgi:hypothetical protein
MLAEKDPRACNLSTLYVGMLEQVYLKFIRRCCQKMQWLVHEGRELNERVIINDEFGTNSM